VIGAGNDYDVFGIYQQGRYTEIQIIFYRNGKMLGGRGFSFERTEMPQDELLASFVLQYYSQAPMIPAEVLLPIEVEDLETLAEVLSEQRGTKVFLACPQRGAKRALVELASKNAQHNFEEKRLSERSDQRSRSSR
jgi:excinuclease ABC subunit C